MADDEHIDDDLDEIDEDDILEVVELNDNEEIGGNENFR